MKGKPPNYSGGVGTRTLSICLWDHSQEQHNLQKPQGDPRNPHSHQGSADHRKWVRRGDPWPFGASQPPFPCRKHPTKSCPLSSTQILMILTQHSQNSALWSLKPSPIRRKVQKDVLTSPLLSPTRVEIPIPQLGLKERFSSIFWEPLPSPPLLQNSFLSLGLFSLLPHKGLTLACFEWTRRQH